MYKSVNGYGIISLAIIVFAVVSCSVSPNVPESPTRIVHQIITKVISTPTTQDDSDNTIDASESTPTITSLPKPLPTSTLSPIKSSYLAYTSARGGGSDIYIIQADGGEPQQLTFGCGSGGDCENTAPSWSHDGSRIAFISDRSGRYKGDFDIYILEVETGEISRLTNTDDLEVCPSWSPGDDYIAYDSDQRDQPGMHIVSLLSGGRRVFGSEEVSQGLCPQWSANGEKIAYYCESDQFGQERKICIADADGNNQRIIEGDYLGFGGFSWSPDSKFIVLVGSTSINDFGLLLINTITEEIELLRPVSGWAYSPTWSPDGNHIAFSSGGAWENEIYIINSDGTGLLQLTENDFDDYDVSWAPVSLLR